MGNIHFINYFTLIHDLCVFRTDEVANTNNNNNSEQPLSPVTPCSSSSSPISPLISPQKEQITPIRSAPNVPTSPSQQEQPRSFPAISPTTTAVVPAPNNISCNVPNTVFTSSTTPVVSKFFSLHWLYLFAVYSHFHCSFF